MAIRMSRKGDVIEFNGGDYRLEQVVIVDDAGTTAKHPTAVADGEEATRPLLWKLYKKRDTDGVRLDEATGEEGPTTYGYVYDIVGEAFPAADEEAAINEAKRLISEG